MENNYHICRHLDEPYRLIIFTIDEAIGLFGLSLFGFFTNYFLWGMIAGLVWVGAMKQLKRGKGAWFFFQVMYWFLPSAITRSMFRGFADSADRHLLS